MNRKAAGAIWASLFTGAAAVHSLTGFPMPDTAVAQPPAQEEISGKQPVRQNRSGPADNATIDWWISEARKVLRQEGIPASHSGIKRNLIRESGGDPTVCNDWDINAMNGTPSCGLLQVIQPTFEANKLPQSAYDRAGVKANANNLTDPITNIVVACNYAYHRYGSMDNVSGAY